MVDPSPTPPSAPAQVFTPSQQALEALLAAIVLRTGEPLVNPTRVTLAVSRLDIESAAGRQVTYNYVRDDLNPFGVLYVNVTA